MDYGDRKLRGAALVVRGTVHVYRRWRKHRGGMRLRDRYQRGGAIVVIVGRWLGASCSVAGLVREEEVGCCGRALGQHRRRRLRGARGRKRVERGGIDLRGTEWVLRCLGCTEVYRVEGFAEVELPVYISSP